MDQELILDGKKYTSSKYLSTQTGYASDYLSRLCRDRKIDGRLVGRNWYVDSISLDIYLKEVEQKKKNYPQLKKGSYEENKGDVGYSTLNSSIKKDDTNSSRLSDNQTDTSDIGLKNNDLWDNYLMSDNPSLEQKTKTNFLNIKLEKESLADLRDTESLKNSTENIGPGEIVNEKHSKQNLSIKVADNTPKIKKTFSTEETRTKEKKQESEIKLMPKKELSKSPVRVKKLYKKILLVGGTTLLFLGLFFAKNAVLDSFLSIFEQSIKIENTASIEELMP